MHKYTIECEVDDEPIDYPPGLKPGPGEGFSDALGKLAKEFGIGEPPREKIRFDILAPNRQWAIDMAQAISDANSHGRWVVECDGMPHCCGPAPVLNTSGAQVPPNTNL